MCKGAFISHNRNACNVYLQLRDGKCIPVPVFWCAILHDYNNVRPIRPVIPEAMMEDVKLR